MNRLLHFLPVFAILLTATSLHTPSVFAAPDHRGNSVLTGVVIGPNDKPVARAAVSYQSAGGNAPHAVHTDARGRFTINKLPADSYEVRASAHGIFSEWEKNVVIHPGQVRTVTLRLIYAKEMPKNVITAGKNE